MDFGRRDLERLAEDYGFLWGDLFVIRTAEHKGAKGIRVGNTVTGRFVDIWVSPGGRKITCHLDRYKLAKG